MIYQTDKSLPKALQKYGCAFTALASYREFYGKVPWTARELADSWNSAIAKGIISGDLNGDGDMDDPGESTIQDWGRLIKHLGLPLVYKGKAKLGTKADFAICAWLNPRTGFVHFVVGDKRPVFFDPIYPGSVTVKEGKPMELGADGQGGLRLFSRLV